jgi:hypothetical protein
MENLENTANSWERLGEVYYRKYHLCKMKEINYKIDYSNCYIAVSRNGGLIAFVKKSKRFIMDVTNPIRDSIRIFYQDGSPIRPIKFGEKEKNIVLFDFTHDENLVCIMHDGRVYKFDIFTSSFNYKIADSIFLENNIIDARLFENGFVCLTANGNFYLINNIKEPKATLFYSTKNHLENYLPSEYLFIPASVTKSEHVELLYPHPKHGLVRVYENGEVKYAKHSTFTDLRKNCGMDNPLSDDLGKVVNIIISPSNHLIGILNDLGNLFVFPASLDVEELQRYMSMTKLSFKPQSYQIMWCSEDCLIIVNNGSIFLIGPENKLIKLDIVKPYHGSNMNSSPNLHCIPEIDGVRIFYDDNVEFLQKVNDDLYMSIFFVSVDPAKKLLEAYKFAEEKRPNCDEEIRKIRHDLPEAVNRLLCAATSQWDISNQIYLVKAAQHGKTFLTKDEFNFNQFVAICKDLRILNNLRTFDYPRLITYDQYRQMEPKQLINRLIKIQNFFLAYEISIFLNLKIRKVYQKWAVAQIKNLPMGMLPSEEIGFYNEIQKKLSEIQGVSYIKLAKKAFKFGKEEIGIKFLENEKSILTKIPQYLELRKWEKALELAFETYDSNVIYTVIDKIMISESIETFKQIVSSYKRAEPIVLEYLKNHHEGLIKDFLEIKKNWEALYFFHVENFFNSSDIDSRRKNIKEIKNYAKLLESTKDKDPNVDWRFFKLYAEDLEKSLFFKIDLLNQDIIKQTDITTFDNSIMDCYKIMTKAEKWSMVESKNKQYFEVNKNKFLTNNT